MTTVCSKPFLIFSPTLDCESIGSNLYPVCLLFFSLLSHIFNFSTFFTILILGGEGGIILTFCKNYWQCKSNQRKSLEDLRGTCAFTFCTLTFFIIIIISKKNWFFFFGLFLRMYRKVLARWIKPKEALWRICEEHAIWSPQSWQLVFHQHAHTTRK